MHHPKGAIFTIIPLIFLSAISAQSTKVVPAANAKTEGSTASAYPFAYAFGHTQQIWSGSAVTSSVALISGISFRRDAGNVTTAFSARSFTNVTMAVGTTTKSPTSMSTTYSSNITSPLTTVVSGAYSLPAQPVPTAKPAAFNVNISWKQPYVLTAAKGNLLLDITLPGPTGKAPYFLDAEYSSGGSNGVVSPFGQNGSFSTPELFSLSADPLTLKAGGTLSVLCGRFQSNYTGNLVVGLSNKTWTTFSLPLDLALIGAPKNNLYVSMDAQFPFNTAALTSTFKAPIPNNSIYQGLTFYLQAYYGDAKANAAGVVATHGLALTTATGASGPETNLVGHYDYTQAVGMFPFGTRRGGPVTQFSGVLP
ncbi:MAG: hypothetical protein ACYST0_03310 [Planctomycetota bacterium]|jgi:hypothetical protein